MVNNKYIKTTNKTKRRYRQLFLIQIPLILKLKNRRKGGCKLVIPTGLRNAFALLVPLASKFATGAVAFLAH